MQNKQRRKTIWKKVCLLCVLVMCAVSVAPCIPALAATPTPLPTIDLSNFQPVSILKVVGALFLSLVALIGYIVVGKSLLELGSAIQNSDNAAITSSLKGLAGGGIMAGASTLMVLFGFVL